MRLARMVPARMPGFKPGPSRPPVRIPITPFFAFTFMTLPARGLLVGADLLLTDLDYQYRRLHMKDRLLLMIILFFRRLPIPRFGFPLNIAHAQGACHGLSSELTHRSKQ